MRIQVLGFILVIWRRSSLTAAAATAAAAAAAATTTRRAATAAACVSRMALVYDATFFERERQSRRAKEKISQTRFFFDEVLALHFRIFWLLG